MHDLAHHPIAIDCERLLAESNLARVEHHRVLASTQDWAHELARTIPADHLPLLVVADEQTAGRGRGSNTWWAGAGSLAFSLLFDPAQAGQDRKALPQHSLAFAVALVDALRSWLPNHVLGFDWPNDVLAEGRKLAGILIDVLPDGRQIIGIGINTNNSLADAPAEVRARAATIRELSGGPVDHTTFLLDLLPRIAAAHRECVNASDQLGRRFNELCLQIGKILTIDIAGRRTTGCCIGIALDGGLMLDTLAGPRTFYSGVLVRDLD